MGARKPGIPDSLVLNVEASTQKMEYSEDFHDRNPRPEWNREELESLKLFACQQIKRFSHAQSGKAVLEYVTREMNVTGPSALDIPLSFHGLIQSGIMHFRSLPRR
jgi:hypothetical protein